MINKKRALCLPSLVIEAYKSGGEPSKEVHGFQHDMEVLRLTLWGRDAIKLTLKLVFKVVSKTDGHRKKTLENFHLSWSALLLWKILQFIGISAELFTAGQDPVSRGKTIGEWSDNEGGPQVLIVTYALQMAGVNAHAQCCNVTMTEAFFSAASDQQVFYRVHRWGASEDQNFYRIMVQDTLQRTPRHEDDEEEVL